MKPSGQEQRYGTRTFNFFGTGGSLQLMDAGFE